MMDSEDKTIENNQEGIESMTNEGDTYPISDNESNSNHSAVSPMEKNLIEDELNDSMSEDSLIDNEEIENKTHLPSSSSSPQRQLRSSSKIINLDEHIKLVKQKKEEADIQRLQRIQEQLRKKEQKCQEQQIVRVKKWSQLRHRDTDHRIQVEERRRKLDDEAKAKFDEIVQREKERKQRTVHVRENSCHKPESFMSISTDILSSRRAVSAPRLRTNQYNMAHRRTSNDSPNTSLSQENTDHSASAISSHQVNSTDEHRYHQRQSRHLHDAPMTTEENSVSGTERTSAQNRSRNVPTSYTYWITTGDNQNLIRANFMRLTYAASCRSRHSRSVERCPRACRVHDETPLNTTTNSVTPPPTTVAAATTTNGNSSQRRVQSVNRQHLNETICRLSKPKTSTMTQSIHLTTPSSSSSPHRISSSQSTHQLRSSTPTTTSTPTTSTSRRKTPSRPVTAPTNHVSANNSSRASPNEELNSSALRQSIHRTPTHSKPPSQSASKPPVSSTFTRLKPPVQRSLMTTSLSSSTLSSSTPNKQTIRRTSATTPTKLKPSPSPIKTLSDTQISIKTNEQEVETAPVIETPPDEEPEVVIESPPVEIQPPIPPTAAQLPTPSSEAQLPTPPAETQPPTPPAEVRPATPPVEPINIDTVIEIINPPVPTAPISKREQQLLEEQEYQRKLNQKIREVQQRLEAERQREEERQRQLELEEYEREQEQIRLAEEQRRAEEERLQRAIEERERENELKRQEELRLQQQREELERKQAEETERLNRERQERAKREEEERNERRKRLDLIMRRTRQVSPSPKPESNGGSKTNIDENNEHESSSIPHSISDNRFPTSVSTDNFLNNNTNDSTVHPETPKFKSPLIQSLLNKARNSRSTDNLSQSNMTTSQIRNENENENPESTTPNRSESSDDDDDDDQHDSGINNTTNGHSSSPLLSSSTNLHTYHDHPIETTTSFQ